MSRHLLREYIRSALQEADRLSLSEMSNPPGGWNFFHITHKNLGKSFVFSPRIPTWVKDCQAEDFTTPRVCLATSVESAVRGKFGSNEPHHFGQPEMFVYASKHLPQMLVPKDGDDLSAPDNEWGNDWSYELFAEKHGLDPSDDGQHAELVRGRVSDDPRVSREVWSLAPTKMMLVGRIWPNETRSNVHQKWLLKPGAELEEGLAGSRPEEHYQDATADNLLFNEPGMSVEPEVRSAIAAYLVKMGLMKPGPCKPKGPVRKARKA